MNKLQMQFNLLRVQRAGIDDFRSLIADCTAEELDEISAVALAARMENEELIRLLIEKGCAVDSTTSNGRTALDIVISEGNLQLVKTLLSFGANPKLHDNRLLFLAAANSRGNGLAIAQLLVEHGIDVNRTFETWGGARMSPLDFAGSQPELAKYLKSVGAKPAKEMLASEA